MSRINIEGKEFDLTFGVDHVTGAFVQLWVSPSIDQDCAVVKIDSFGVRVDTDQSSVLTKPVTEFLMLQEKRFESYKKTTRQGMPNIDEQLVIDFALIVGGFPDITTKVYEIFD